jgi:hypothetical protein
MSRIFQKGFSPGSLVEDPVRMTSNTVDNRNVDIARKIIDHDWERVKSVPAETGLHLSMIISYKH